MNVCLSGLIIHFTNHLPSPICGPSRMIKPPHRYGGDRFFMTQMPKLVIVTHIHPDPHFNPKCRLLDPFIFDAVGSPTCLMIFSGRRIIIPVHICPKSCICMVTIYYIYYHNICFYDGVAIHIISINIFQTYIGVELHCDHLYLDLSPNCLLVQLVPHDLSLKS